MHDKTLAILFPGCAPFELYLAAQLLHGTYPLEVATPDGQAHHAENGFSHAAQHAFADVAPRDYRVVLAPGGDVESVYDDDDLLQLLTRADADDATLVAAICNGVWLAARSGILDSRSCTHTCVDKYGAPPELLQRSASDFRQTRYVDQDVVHDEVITAKPWAYVEFGVAVARACDVLGPEEALSYTSYYRWQPQF